MRKYYYTDDRIAIVGMGGIYPDADDIQTFWQNILANKVSIKEIPDSIFDTKIHYRPERFKKINKDDKTYTRMASMVNYDAVLAVGKKFKIPPAVAEHMDQNQHAAIYCVDQALQSLRGQALPLERTAVILGNGNPGAQYERAIERVFYDVIQEHLRNNPLLLEKLNTVELEKVLRDLSAEVLKDALPLTEDSAPGILQNLVAGRIANVFGFQGPSFMIDAACASSLAAVISGVQGLLRREYDAVISGGIDLGLQAMYFAAFSAINALSPEGSFPFDKRANGFIIGSGGGVLVLKRLEDALRDRDNIIALISGYGQGSDGKGKYIAAPNEDGQARVIEAACRMAGYPVDTIELMEAHGTGTSVGDLVEVNGLKKAFSALGCERTNYCGLGSVKSNIGHLKAAAGGPGMIKASLALYHKILPPTANIQEINPKLQLEGSPFYILTEQRDWPEHADHPRRANVSAFGFGGTDFHITLEEFRTEFYQKVYAISESTPVNQRVDLGTIMKNQTEVLLFSGESREALTSQYQGYQEESSRQSFGRRVFQHNAKVSARQKVRLAICASSDEDLAKKWRIFEDSMRSGPNDQMEELALHGIHYHDGPVILNEQVAMLFPGQASQYPNMEKELIQAFPVVQSIYAQADAWWQAHYGYSITSLIFGEDEAALEQGLKETKNTHPAMFLSSAGLYKLFSESGVKAEYLIGHSLGEMTALYAGEMLDLPSALTLIGARGFSFDAIPKDRRGKMMSIKADRASVETLLDKLGYDIRIANLNSPEQTVVGGDGLEIDSFNKVLTEQKIIHTVLNVSHAFHTPLVAEAAENFYSQIAELPFSAPRAKICLNHLQEFYPDSAKALKEIPQILKDQIVSSVRFADSIEMLYAKGVRVFLEVGPSTVLSNLVRKILEGKAVSVIAANQKRKNAVESYHQALAELFTLGIEVRMVPSLASLSDGPTPRGDIDVNCKPNAVDPTPSPELESLVYSGVSMGLPGSFKKLFDDDNFNLLCAGHNFIESLPEQELQDMLDLNITRLIKKEGASTFKRLSSINDLIRLAGKIGDLNIVEDYRVDEELLKQMTTNICAGVAAGYEALKDARIPLVQEWQMTSAGTKIPGRLMLPKEMQAETGIIFASCFTKIEPFIREVSKFIADKFGRQTKRELVEFYETLILKISDPETKQLLTDWFAEHYNRLQTAMGGLGVYEFNNNFMAQFSSLANNRLAQFIGATGPNFQLSAACSSTAYAVTVAESLIRSGQAQRMIVIGAENATSKALLPWIGGGFLTSGAATNEANIYKAAVPFDNRRNGMIIGAGAVGIVLEKEAAVAARGMNGICRLMGTHAFNLAGHQTRIDSKKFSFELDRFISRMERTYQIDRNRIAAKLLYVSHETYTPKKGGCSQTEKAALEATFGDRFREILVTNTKGMTGHSIGASVEEAVAAKALQYQKVPPVVNYQEPDPELAGLKLATGGTHGFDYALRMVAGFGGQGNYILMQKVAVGDQRIIDQTRYQSWLEKVAGASDPQLSLEGRLLVAKGKGSAKSPEMTSVKPSVPECEPNAQPILQPSTAQTVSRGVVGSTEKIAIADRILDIYSTVTKYPKEMLELNMEMEADLGIDTVKQATIFVMIAEAFQLEQVGDIQLSDYPTIGHIIEFIASKVGSFEQVAAGQREVAASASLADAPAAEGTGEDRIAENVLRIIAEVTKYPVDMLELDMEMEADLGIDTVKQATVISIIADQYGVAEGDGPRVSTLPTIRDLINFVRQSIATETSAMNGVKKAPISAMNEPETIVTSDVQINDKAKEAGPNPLPPKGEGGIKEAVLGIIAEVTKYPVEMLEPDMEMEADLGIDTVKQATIFSILGERFGFDDDQAINISEYNTIVKVIAFVQNLAARSDSLSEDDTESPQGQMTLESPVQKVEAAKPNQSDLCYQIPVAVERKLPAKSFTVKDKNIWVIGNQEDGVHKIAGSFGKDVKSVKIFVFSASMNPKKLADQVGSLPIQPGDLLIDCGNFGHKPQTKFSVQDEKCLLYLNSEARFIFYKTLQGRVGESLRIICLASSGVLPGDDQRPSTTVEAYSGALCGFYRGLRKEWQESVVKLVDFRFPEAVETIDHRFATALINEIEAGGSDYEIIYNGKTRQTILLGDLDQADLEPLTLPRNPHFLFTGGANGITAEIALGLAQSVKGRFTLIGRTALPPNITELALMDEERLNRVKTEIHNRLKQTETKVTPFMVETEFNKITKAISAYRLMERIEQTGSHVRYFACDVRALDNLEGVINEAVKQFGPVHAVIHGAGVEKSHLLKDKSLVEFQEVFSVKAEGICKLLRTLDIGELKVLIAFSSISGRFGNQAQLDYCAANSFLSSMIRMVKACYPHVHALSIDWSGWKELGMAWRNEFVKHHSEEMGINLIEPARGVQALIKLLMQRSQHDEIVVSKGLKGFVDPNEIHSDLRETPLIDWATRRQGQVQRAYKLISVKKDPIFDHHRLGATPLVPAVAMMEMGAEFHRLLFGRKESYCFRELKVLNPIKLFRDQPQEVFIEPVSVIDSSNLALSINSCFIPKIGDPQRITHCRMNVNNQLSDYSAITDANRVLLDESMAETTFGVLHASPRWQFKNNIAFGPLFVDDECRANNKVAYNEHGMVYTYTMPREQIENKAYQLENLLINPCLMDTVFQSAAIHALTQHDRIHLPLSVDEMGILRVPRQVETVTIIARLLNYDGEYGTYDIIMVDVQGSICCYAKNVLLRRINL